MQFAPKTAQEIAKEAKERAEKNLLPKGVYDFEVMTAEDAVSKRSGAEMIKLSLKVFASDGREQFVTDYLLASMEHKLYHFAHGTGLGALYDAGNFTAADCDGACGKVKIKIEKDETYGSKNVVQDYVAPAAKDAATPTAKAAPADDEESPFK